MALGGFLALSMLSLLYPSLSLQSGLYNVVSNSLYYLFFLPIPLAIGFAMLRYRLYDIDVLIICYRYERGCSMTL